MKTVAIRTAKATLSQLLARVEAGEDIIIARGKTPTARLAPFQPMAAKRQYGAVGAIISIGPEFFEPLPEPERAAWE